MNASKENCAEAMRIIDTEGARSGTTLLLKDYNFLMEFMEKAHSKLPREESYAIARKPRKVAKADS